LDARLADAIDKIRHIVEIVFVTRFAISSRRLTRMLALSSSTPSLLRRVFDQVAPFCQHFLLGYALNGHDALRAEGAA
jgi:hypothetical protein